MARLPITVYPHPVLTTPTREVVVDDGIREILRDMAETMYVDNGIGLAAPQVGLSIRVAVVDVPADGDLPASGLLYLVNPKIVASSGSAVGPEGCLSFPGLDIDVKRATDVTVEYVDDLGQPQTLSAKGLLAICLQHEIDHLDGIVFVDRLDKVRRALALRDYERGLQRMAAHRNGIEK